jgi:hypothetical protein
MPEDSLGSQSDHFGRSVAFLLFFTTQSLYVWVMRTIIIIIICFHVRSFVLPFSPAFFLLYFLLDKATNNRDSREQQDKRAIFSSVAFNSIRCQIDRQIYNETEEKRVTTNSNDIVYFD